ncbi:hypothetical protein GUJ93_ZPchr0008g12271 [Zizania palustris]|uniref:Uncharacterized protein n=1 Tax=Zizania palustris TaxID=103762 RepID=A0A8J5UWD3_ZIZPA|nr:hypothetical protein GUJ93_ZPchr0008g12271 [Zizania palustris]
MKMTWETVAVCGHAATQANHGRLLIQTAFASNARSLTSPKPINQIKKRAPALHRSRLPGLTLYKEAPWLGKAPCFLDSPATRGKSKHTFFPSATAMDSSSVLLTSSCNNKRTREAGEGACSPEADAKRLRPEDLLDVLELDDDNDAVGDLASVMRSFEEEIAAGDAGDAAVATQPELGFLLEASDDELGLPPATASSSDEAGAVDPDEALVFGGQIWEFEDELGGGYVGYGVTSPDAAAAATEWDDGGFDAGLFGFVDEPCAPSDLAALRQGTMPAIG